jgi:hypothetical protein
MTLFRDRFGLAAILTILFGLGYAAAQPPKDEEKKKDEPPTKEELALRQGSRAFLYKFAPGEEIQSEARQKRIEHRNVHGKLKTDTREVQLKLVLNVESVLANGGAQIRGRVAQVKFTRLGQEMRKYDSQSQKNSEDASEGWELFTDAKFMFNVDARGTVSNFRPDAATAAFWKQQPRELRPLVSDDVVKTFLPFIALPTDLVRRGTDWKEKRTLLDETFGKREVTINFSYHGAEQISGRTYQDIRLRGEAKQSDAKPKFEIVEHHGDGKVSFDMARGNLREFRFDETYLFNPPGSELVDKPDEKEKKKSSGGRSGRGSGAPPGMSGGSLGGMSGGAGNSSGGAPGGIGGKKPSAKKSKEEKKKEKDETESKPVNQSIKVELENEVKIDYRGKPVSGE